MKRSTKAILISSSVILLAGLAFGLSAIYKYQRHQHRANEVVLQQNLWAMRRAIDFYSVDKNKAPVSLQGLVDAGYLREIPIDPLTNSNKTWIIQNAATSSGQPAETGITDIHSGAKGADASGKPYNQY
jgi:general secretion pathway protein G